MRTKVIRLWAVTGQKLHIERSFHMIYSKEVEEMCTVAQGVNHGCAPIPEEANWVKVKEEIGRASCRERV